MKGEIYKEDGMYYLVVDESNDVNQLKGRIKVLEDDLSKLVEENKKIKEKSESNQGVGSDLGVGVGLEADLYEARVQWEYYEDLYKKEVADKQERIRKCFRWLKKANPKADWDEFRDWVMGDEG